MVATPSAQPDLMNWLVAQGGTSLVRIATDKNGLRGLEAMQDASVGDVLLQVPLTAVLADASEVQLTQGAAPAWTAPLPSMVQLAVVAALHHNGEKKTAGSPWEPYLESWPAGLPELPSNVKSPETLMAANVEREFVSQVFASQAWFAEQHEKAAALHADAKPGESFPDLEDFRTAVQLAGSRCLRVSCGALGRELRFLVPVVDMANHDGVAPSAIYACGPYDAPYDASSLPDDEEGGTSLCVQLRAARPISEGDAVTISYGEHSNEHFAQFYGFIPHDNPYDALEVSLMELLRALPDGRVRQSREAMVQAAEEAGFAVDELKLHARAPAAQTTLALRAALSPDGGRELAEMLDLVLMDEIDDEDLCEIDDDESAAERALLVAAVCRRREAELEEAATDYKEEDGVEDSSAGDEGAKKLLAELPRSRKRLLTTLRTNMEWVASGGDEADGGARAAFEGLQDTPSAFPYLERGGMLNTREL
jgi:hypothetical protein